MYKNEKSVCFKWVYCIICKLYLNKPCFFPFKGKAHTVFDSVSI
jgi:hypothetical protein